MNRRAGPLSCGNRGLSRVAARRVSCAFAVRVLCCNGAYKTGGDLAVEIAFADTDGVCRADLITHRLGARSIGVRHGKGTTFCADPDIGRRADIASLLAPQLQVDALAA